MVDLTDIGVWQGKALMINKQTKHKKWANLTWISDSRVQKMKINVYAVLDIPVASYLSSEENTDLWLFTEDKHYQSTDGAKLFKYLTKIEIDPKVFFSLLGRPEAPGGSWSCTDVDRLLRCQSKSLKIKLSVNYGDKDQRNIEIYRQDQLLRLKLTRSKVEVKARHFKSISTPHYRTIKI